MATSKDKTIEVLDQERRRRWSVEEKLAMVRESLGPGQSVSVAARRNAINPNQLFHWRKLYQDGSLSAVSAGEAVVPASTTPVCSPQSNGMAESFVKTMKRDYIRHMPKPDRATALRNLAIAFEHYKEEHPHSALNYRSSCEFRRLADTST